MAKNNRMTLDGALRPLEITCGGCRGKMVVYPDAHTGIGYCPTCSPSWLKDFAIYCMNGERTKRELMPI